jgi:uncharacterized protein (TIGR02271 family)
MDAERAAPAAAGARGGEELTGVPAVRPGAPVEARDGRMGTVEEVVVHPETGELASLVVRRGWTDRLLYVAAAEVDRLDSGAVRLRVTRDEAERLGAGVPQEAAGGAFARQAGDRVTVPVLEERLAAETRAVDLGELRVRKTVETEEARVTQEVTRDDLLLERVPVNRPLEAPAASRVEGDWYVVPVMEEVLVVRKQLMLKEEVRIRRQPVTAEQEVRETLRRERVELEDATRDGVRGADAPPAGRGADSPDRQE